MNLKAIESVELTGRASVVRATVVLESGRPSAELQEVATGIQQGKKYDLTIKERGKKRSLSANAYAWALIEALAQTLGLSKEEVYREEIRHYGTCLFVSVAHSDCMDFKKSWEAKGLGWTVIPLNGYFTPGVSGRVELQCFPGSSTYTVKEMTRLIDGVVSECQQLGVETKTPAEIAALLEDWKGENHENASK